MTDLPPYSYDTRCPKCTCPTIGDTYHAQQPHLVWSGSELDFVTTFNGQGTSSECMLRRCTDCGWAWLEACADAPPASTDPADTANVGDNLGTAWVEQQRNTPGGWCGWTPGGATLGHCTRTKHAAGQHILVQRDGLVVAVWPASETPEPSMPVDYQSFYDRIGATPADDTRLASD